MRWFTAPDESGNVILDYHLTMGFKEANRIICFKKDI